NVAVALAVQGGPEVLVPGLVEPPLVPAAEVVDGKAMTVLGAVEETHVVVDHVCGKECSVSNPPWSSPGKCIQLDRGVAGLRLFHQPPLITAAAIEVARRMAMARLGAADRVRVAADFDLEDLHRRADARLE